MQTVSGAKVHVYMGKIGNYEGPNIRKIFQKLETLKRYMTNVKEPYYNALVAFKQVSESVFGTELHPSWREHLPHLKDVIHVHVSLEGMPLTPKLHVLTVHVEQWIDRNGHAIGKKERVQGKPSIIFGRGWRKAKGKSRTRTVRPTRTLSLIYS